MLHGMLYDSAYVEAVKITDKLRNSNQELVLKQKTVIKSNPIVRDTGVKFWKY
jgi:hypothetical protein